MFNEKDIRQIENRGVKVSEVEKQIAYFRNGIPTIELVHPAVIGDGIDALEKEEEEKLISIFDNHRTDFSMMKFIPASGAASRMFKTLFEARTHFRHHPGNEEVYMESHPLVREFFENLQEYPFYFDLKKKAAEKHLDFDLMLKENKYEPVLHLLLGTEGLNYGEMPKGLLKFHSYGEISRTAFEEHFEETLDYLSDNEDEVRLHFTVSPAYRDEFEKRAKNVSEEYAENRGTNFIVGFSEQEPSTDTIAVDLNNEPFRDHDGNLVFRPGGHGALLGNLQNLEVRWFTLGISTMSLLRK